MDAGTGVQEVEAVQRVSVYVDVNCRDLASVLNALYDLMYKVNTLMKNGFVRGRLEAHKTGTYRHVEIPDRLVVEAERSWNIKIQCSEINP